MFAYTLDIKPKDGNWSRYESPEPYNPIIDFVVASINISSNIHPRNNNPLELLHKNAARWYRQAVNQYHYYNLKSSYVWHDNAWQQKV